MKVKFQQNRWYNEEPVTIDLPDEWDVHIAEMNGDKLPVLTQEQIREKIENGYGASLKELAKGKKRVVILFDDISRPTPVKNIAEIVLMKLHEAGVSKDSIIFICALGMHGAHTRIEFVKKLGDEIVREYPVFNHNPYENCVYVGKTMRGTEVEVNAEVMKCDLKIGIGSIVPHPYVAFGGGSKIIMPGVSSVDSIEQNHNITKFNVTNPSSDPYSMLANIDNKEMREDVEEAAKLAGLDFKIDALLNTKCQIVGLYAGNPIEEYYAAVPMASEVYKTEEFEKVDICIANANAKSSEALTAKLLGVKYTKKGGDVVIINHCIAGQVPHYLVGPFGLETKARMFNFPKKAEDINNIIIYTPYPDYSSGMTFGIPEQIKWASTWEQVLEILGKRNKRTKVAVIKDATLQYFKKCS